MSCLSETSIRNKNIQKYVITPYCKERMSIIASDENAFSKKKDDVFFRRGSPPYFYNNIVGVSRTWTTKNVGDLRFGLIYLYLKVVYQSLITNLFLYL